MKLPVAKEGLTLIKLFLIFSIGGYLLGHISKIFYIFALCFLIFTLFSIYFFRNPERNITCEENVVLSPADGKVFDIVKDGDDMVVKIFMSVFNVHVQRSPIGGRVESVEYKPGKFLHAMNLHADKENEQKLIAIRGKEVCVKVKQIAGIIARRIVSWIKEGDVVEQGQRIGMIKFGSQVDLIVPEEVGIVVKKGDKVKAGISVIGRLLT